MPDEPVSTFADQAATFVGLQIPGDCRPGVVANLEILRDHARRVMDFALDPQMEIALEFRA